MGELSNIKFTTPEYDETIPSTGETVKVKPFKVGDEKTLMIAAESKDQKQIINALRNVVNKCIVEDVNLAYFDYEYLFLKLRAKSVGEVSTIMATCENTECGHKNKIDLDLESVKISEVEDIDPLIKLTDDVAIKMKHMPIDEAGKIDGTKDFITALSKSISQVINGDEVVNIDKSNEAELVKTISDWPTTITSKIKPWFDNVPRAYCDVEFTCEKCGTVNSRRLEGLENFF